MRQELVDPPYDAMDQASPVSPTTRQEARFVVCLWLLACAYTIVAAWLFAYKPPHPISLILGMPAWAFWGVLLPWTVCTAVTIWFALCRMRDESLDSDGCGDE